MEFFSVARLLASQPVPAGGRIGILTNAGGPAILAVDAAEAAGLKIPQLGEATKKKLRQSLHPTAAINNPIDITANGGPSNTAPAWKRSTTILTWTPFDHLHSAAGHAFV